MGEPQFFFTAIKIFFPVGEGCTRATKKCAEDLHKRNFFTYHIIKKARKSVLTRQNDFIHKRRVGIKEEQDRIRIAQGRMSDGHKILTLFQIFQHVFKGKPMNKHTSTAHSVQFSYDDIHQNSNTQTLIEAMKQTMVDDSVWAMLTRFFAYLTTYITPYGKGSVLWFNVMEYLLPDVVFNEDGFGNVYVVVGDSPTVMFTSHVDTVSTASTNFSRSFDGRFVRTDGATILGADDKAGVAAMLTMIQQGRKGLYYFFDGEECGGKGSSAVAKKFTEQRQFDGIKYCISLDRKEYSDIITYQAGGQCCSLAFASSLSDALAKQGMFLDPCPDGIYTDSAEFVGMIAECTNLSVGYFGEHTTSVKQDMNFLYRLTKALIALDDSTLIVDRKILKNRNRYSRHDDE